MDNWRSYAGVIEGEEEVIAKLEELGVGVKRTNEALTEAVEYLELNFIGFYGVLLEFEKRKRMSVNIQGINSKLWIMGWIMEGAKCCLIFLSLLLSFSLKNRLIE